MQLLTQVVAEFFFFIQPELKFRSGSERSLKEKQGSGWHEQIKDYSERCRVILYSIVIKE